MLTQSLKELSLRDILGLREEFLHKLGDNVVNLEKLDLSGLELTDQALMSLGGMLAKLKYINLSRCKGITVKGLVNFC